MTDKAEFERLLDVYGFRCERFGQDLSTHARAQVVSAFAALASAPADERAAFESRMMDNGRDISTADGSYIDDTVERDWQALASAPVAGEAQKPVAWMLVGRLKNSEPKFTLADPTGIYESVYAPLYAAPQASEAVRNADVSALLSFIFGRFGQPGDAGELPDTVAAAVRRLERAMRPQADKDGCTCPSGDGSLRHPCPMHPGADKDGGQQRARDSEELRSRVLSAIHDVADLKPEDDETWDEWYCAAFDLLGSRVGDIFHAALSAPQTEQGERD